VTFVDDHIALRPHLRYIIRGNGAMHDQKAVFAEETPLLIVARWIKLHA
jgi:hypothetical protein